MLRHANNKHQTFIAKTGVTYAGGLGSTNIVTKDNLPDGAVAIVTLGNKVIDAIGELTAVDRFKIVQSRGPNYPLTFSPVIEKSAALNVAQSPYLTATGIPYAAATQQETTFGTFVPEDITSYYLVIEKEDNDAFNNKGYWPAITAQFKTSSSSSIAELYLGLGASLQSNLLFEAGSTKYLRARVDLTATDAAVTGAGSTPTGFNATYGIPSIEITATGAVVDDVVAGGILKLATTEGDDCYGVVSTRVSGTSLFVTLDSPYRGSTISGGAVPENSTTVTAGSLILTGWQPPFDVLRNRNYSVNRFNARLNTGGESAGAAVTTVGAYAGVGTWEQAAMDEFLSWGFLGNARAVVATPPGVRPSTVVEGSAYSVIQLVEKTNIPAMTSFSSSAMSYLIYVENTDSGGGTVTGQGDTLATILGNLTID